MNTERYQKFETLHSMLVKGSRLFINITLLMPGTMYRNLFSAIGDADAVICAVGASSAISGKDFDEVDRKVRLSSARLFQL